MHNKLENLKKNLQKILSNYLIYISEFNEELTIIVKVNDYIDVAKHLLNNKKLKFEQLIDLCGVDYKLYGNKENKNLRFAVVIHLLSLTYNWRLRVRVFSENNEIPNIPSITKIWNSANWYEREAFDLYGIIFDGHPDLRRILTDYEFVGHPFRKDFPISGHSELYYDNNKKEILHRPVTINPRDITPRIIREDRYIKQSFEKL